MVRSNVIIRNVLRFFFLILIQVYILNNINLGGFVNPYLYIYFILLLPFGVPGWMLLLCSLLIGMGIDIFTNTMGLNISASLATGFARPYIINAISTGPDSLIGDTPSLKNQGLKWFLYYSVSLIIIHHSILFYLEIFRFSEFFLTFQRVILSGIFTLVLVLISEYIFYYRER